mmetsp:Transcript_21575/g.49045  ORF Transcript_21575/g.49045 Transcript_21575/m.49045 type:complete len:295 (-) Transcript_21575:1004-1888(-)
MFPPGSRNILSRFYDKFHPFPFHSSKGTVGINQFERSESGVHLLFLGHEILHHGNRKQRHGAYEENVPRVAEQRSQGVDQRLGQGRASHGSLPLQVVCEGGGYLRISPDAAGRGGESRGVVESEQNRHDREPVEKGEVSGEYEDPLKSHLRGGGAYPPGAWHAWKDQQPGQKEFHHVVDVGLEDMPASGHPMEKLGEGARNWHGFIEGGHGFSVPPAAIMGSELDEARAQHDAKGEPAHGKNGGDGDWTGSGGHCIFQGHEGERAYGANFRKKRLPAIRIEGFPDGGEREVEDI